MVEKLTLFELHFDGATFGPTVSPEATSDETVAEDEIPAEEAATNSGGRGRKVIGLVVASIVVSVVVSTIARRLAGDDEMDFETVDFESEEDESAEEIDVAEA